MVDNKNNSNNSNNSINYINYHSLIKIILSSLNKIIFIQYNDLCKLLFTNRLFNNIVSELFIEHDYILLDFIAHKVITKQSIKTNYLYNLYNKWNIYNNNRIKYNNIYLYIKLLYSERITNVTNIPFDIFKNIGIKLLYYSSYIYDIPAKYMDLSNKYAIKICDINFAYYAIYNYNNKIYHNKLAKHFYNYKDNENFKLLCFAIKKHITIFKHIDQDYLTNKQIYTIITINPKIYKYLKIKYIKNNIIQYIILNYYNSYNLFKKHNNNLYDNIIIIISYFKNNINDYKNININKNFVYFILNCLTKNENKYITEEHKLIILDKMKDNILFNTCYNKLQPYISNNYIIFDYPINLIKNITDNDDYKYNKFHRHKNMNNEWKYEYLLEDDNIILLKIFEEINTILLTTIKSLYDNEDIYMKIYNKVKITKINLNSFKIIYNILIKNEIIDHKYHIYKINIDINKRKLLINNIIKNSIDINYFDKNLLKNIFITFAKQKYLIELCKLENIEYQVSELLTI